MTELQEAPDSTVIDTDIDPIKSGGGKMTVETDKPETRKNESVRDSLEAEAKRISSQKPEDDDDDQDQKPEKVESKDKPSEAKKEEPKPEKVEAKESVVKADNEQEVKTPKPSEGRKIIEAPARFLPRAKELWKNVPNEVREEWQRLDSERENEVSRYRESQQFRDELKEFEDEARQSGTTVKNALTAYVSMEKALRSDPATGFKALLQNMQMHPIHAMGHIMKAAGWTPQQVAEHMQREPNAYIGLTQPQQQQTQQPQQRQPDPELMALRQEVEAMRAERVSNELINPFRKEFGVDDTTWQDIEKVLLSGILDQIHGGISPRDKLERALAMVAPDRATSRASNGQDDSVHDFRQDTAPVGDLRGDKSVKSSPGGVTETVEPDRKLSMRDMLEEEARKLSRRA